MRSSLSGSEKWEEASIVLESPSSSSWSTMRPTALGGRFEPDPFGFRTDTLNCWDADSPSGSSAVTVMVADPFSTALTSIFPRDTHVLATLKSELAALNSRTSSSGSPKYAEGSTLAIPPFVTRSGGMVPTGNGARPDTVKASFCTAFKPSGSMAVVVTVASPLVNAAMVMTVPEAETAATAVSEIVALKASVSPSGSAKREESSRVVVSPALTTCSPAGPVGDGGRLGTATVNSCVAARPSGSLAVTVRVAMPLAIAVTARMAPMTEVPAIAGSEAVAVKVRGSVSGSAKYPDRSRVVVSPTARVSARITRLAAGARLGTVTVNSCAATRPSVSVADTVTVTEPFAWAATFKVPPETATPTTPLSEAGTAKTRKSPSGSVK